MYTFWTDIFVALGEASEWALAAVPAIHNIPNYLLSFVGLGAFIYWMKELKRFSREEKA